MADTRSTPMDSSLAKEIEAYLGSVVSITPGARRLLERALPELRSGIALAASTTRSESAPIARYGIVNAAGKMWMSEVCVCEEPENLDAELEDARRKDPTYRIVPLAPLPEAK